MLKHDFISYLKKLRPEDWTIKVTPEWTVKDLVAHMVGWEKYDPQIIRETWKTKESPWWHNEKDYDEYNRKEVKYYKNYTPRRLVKEWEKWQDKVKKEINRIGKHNLKTRLDLFKWLFDESASSHYAHHLRQVKDAVESVK